MGTPKDKDPELYEAIGRSSKLKRLMRRLFERTKRNGQRGPSPLLDRTDHIDNRIRRDLQ